MTPTRRNQILRNHRKQQLQPRSPMRMVDSHRWTEPDRLCRSTTSTWDPAERGLEGPLRDVQLEAPRTRFTFWFAYVGAFPQAEVCPP